MTNPAWHSAVDPVRLSHGFVKRYDALIDLERAKAEQLSRLAANSLGT